MVFYRDKKPLLRLLLGNQATLSTLLAVLLVVVVARHLQKAERRDLVEQHVLVQLLDYYRDPHRAPFPSRAELGRRIGVKPKTIQTNMRQLEQAGLVRREMRKTAAGDWASNIYHLDGLVERVKKLEPEFTEARKEREAARARVSTPVGRRRS